MMDGNATTSAPAPAVIDPVDEGFGLYVHWPFCISKCPYCDFNSHVSERIDQAAWRAALLKELEYFAARVPGRTLTSIFFGGGTPSLMDPATAAEIIAAARKAWTAHDTIEITLEANPGTVDAARFADIRAAGVNRLSMGVQALNNWDLAFLGRKHSVADARAAWTAAAKIFPRVSFDLIYARPGQTLEAWRAELTEALKDVRDNNIGHLSLYQLTLEQGTAMAADHAKGAFKLPDDDTAADLFAITQEMCAKAGYPAYEISNHARSGEQCRHNLTYWRGGDFVGIGPGAHGRLTLGTIGADGAVIATRQVKAPSLWLKKVEAEGHGTQAEEPLKDRARTEELVMMGLRLAEGLDKARFKRQAGHALLGAIDPAAAARLGTMGFLAESERRITVTPSGRLALNEVLRQLLAA